MFNSVTLWNVALQAPLPSTISQSWFKFMSIESVILSNHLILCHSLLFDLQSFPASESFPMNQLFESGGLSIRASASASVLPANIQGWFPLGLTDLLSLLPKDSQESSPAPQSETINSSVLSLVYGPTLTPIHDYWKNHCCDYMDLFGKVIFLLFKTLSRFVIVFLPRSKHLLISQLQLPSAVILEPKKIKSVTASTFSPSTCHEVMGLDAMILDFECGVSSQLFHSPLSPSSRASLVPLHFLPLEW